MSVTRRAARGAVTPASVSARRAPPESTARGECQGDVLALLGTASSLQLLPWQFTKSWNGLGWKGC